MMADFADSFEVILERDSEGNYTGKELRQCWLIGQRASLVDNRLLYHEGFFLKGDGVEMPHAWNTLNGKILDYAAWRSSRSRFPRSCYQTVHTYTTHEICTALRLRGGWWGWMCYDDLRPSGNVQRS